jgi:hypothetical protein
MRTLGSSCASVCQCRIRARVKKRVVLLLLECFSSMSSEHSMPAKSRLLVEQAIDEAMEDLAHRNEARAKRDAEQIATPPDRFSRIGVKIAMPALAALMVWNFTAAPRIAVQMIGPAISRQEAEIALNDVVNDIDAFVADYGEAPVSLAEVGLPTSGVWKYTRLAKDRYRLDMTFGGHSLVFVK